MTTTAAHALTFEVPTARDYLNGGFGDIVAQCACGAFEYVYMRTEGAYWHGLHSDTPATHPHFLLVESPMPEGWVEIESPTANIPVFPAAARTYTCSGCIGAGAVPAYGAFRGRFYHFGERMVCPQCEGSGTADYRRTETHPREVSA